MLLPLFEQRDRSHRGQQNDSQPQGFSTRSAYYLAVGVAVSCSIILCGLMSGAHTMKYMLLVSVPEISLTKDLNPSGLFLNVGTPKVMTEAPAPPKPAQTPPVAAVTTKGFYLRTKVMTPEEEERYRRKMAKWPNTLPTVNRYSPPLSEEYLHHGECPFLGDLPAEMVETETWGKAGDDFETMPDGCRKHGPTGIKIWKMSDVCIGPDRVFIVARNESEYAQLHRCCFGGEALTEGCAANVVERCRSARCTAKIGGTSLKVHLLNQSEIADHNVHTVKGNSYWIHTPTREEHFGHWLNRVMQYFAITHDATEPAFPKLDRLVTRQNRPVFSHLKTVASTILGGVWNTSIYGEEIKAQPFEMVCMERTYEVAAAQLEVTIFTEQQGELWREFSKQNFKKFGYTNVDNCPPPKAVVLQRTEGTGRRMILNYDVVDRVFGRLGIPYTNISLGGADGSDRQIGLFNDFGLMISSHSSQLKNLLWAPRNAVVLETRGTPPGYMQPSPFATGMGPLDVIFHESVGHIPNYESCPEPHGCREFKMYKVDYWLNEAIFEESVKKALAAQRERCGGATQWR